ncbi:hypothetical protein H4219_002882 [Mycoemilia scoparia]|uniref:ATP-dependent bile acid permease n=1 Tax=Mycoemilia scoparia TaxID=417184 RepID=A0A9W7ZWF5_9FUNG|nr:hypothetical protein H4219_002882 [Mycoemilia scoparia]
MENLHMNKSVFLFEQSVFDSAIPTAYIAIFGVAGLYRLAQSRLFFRQPCYEYLDSNNGQDGIDHNEQKIADMAPDPTIPTKKADNRLLMGIISCPLVLASWYSHIVWYTNVLGSTTPEKSLPLYQHLAVLVQAACWSIIVISTILDVALFRANSSRQSFYGPAWSKFTYRFYVLSLLTSLVNGYFNWFAAGRETVPFFSGADINSKLLMINIGLSACLVFTFTLSHYAPQYQVAYNKGSAPINSGVLYPEQKLAPTPEFGNSWFSAGFFVWLSPMVSKGARKTLGYHDLYRLQPENKAGVVWKRYLKNKKPGRNLVRTLIWTFWPEMGFQFFCSVSHTLIIFSNPYFLQRILQYIQDPSIRSRRAAFLDAFLMLVVSLVCLVIQNQVLWTGRRIGFRMKGVLVAEISKKTLRRRGKVAPKDEGDSSDDRKGDEKPKDSDNDDDEDIKDGDSDANDGKVMNLMTTDFSRVTETAAYLDELYECPIQLVVGMTYLYKLLGPSAFASVFMMVIYYLFSKKVMNYITKTEETLSAISDKRLAKVTEMIQGMRIVKLFGWESRFVGQINELREKQLLYLWKFLRAWCSFFFVTGFGPMTVILATFTLYCSVFGHTMTAELAFTSMSLLQILRVAFDHFPSVINWAVTAYVSLKRISSYLEQEEVQPLSERLDTEPATDGNGVAFINATLTWDESESKDTDESSNPSVNADNNEQQASTQTLNTVNPQDNTKNAIVSSETQPLLLSTPNNDGRNTSYLSLQSTASKVSAATQKKEPFRLENINISFPENAMTLIAGPTGCGKTSLLQALIGELTLTEGKIRIPVDANRQISDVAYIAQEAWLCNDTIRNNILFGELYDKIRYEKVLNACALKSDLRTLPSGDSTLIGERGVTLSGGQKQRVALARAVYSSAKYLLIDDCLSAVDAHTAKHILQNCLLDTEHLMRGRTRILVTHHVSLCLEKAGWIVAISNGKIAFQGSPEDVAKSTILTKILGEDSVKKLEGTGDEEQSGKTKKSDNIEANLDDVANGKAKNDAEKTEDEFNAERKAKALQAAKDKGDDAEYARLCSDDADKIEEEEINAGHVKLEVWLTYFRAIGGKWFWIVFLGGHSTGELFQILQDYWIRVWVSTNESSTSSSLGMASVGHLALAPQIQGIYWLAKLPFNAVSMLARVTLPYGDISADMSESSYTRVSSPHTLFYWFGIYLLIGIIYSTLRYVTWLYSSMGSIRASRTLHRDLLSRVVHATPKFYETTPIGRIINRFSKDMQALDEWGADVVGWWFTEILSTIGILIVVTYVTPIFFFIAIVIMLVYLVVTTLYLTTTRELKRMESNTLSPLLSHFGETILGATTIRAFGKQDTYIETALDRIDTNNRPFYLVWGANRWLCVWADLSGAVVIFLSALLIVSGIYDLDAGLAGFSLSYALSFSVHMLFLVRAYGQMELNMNSVERVRQYFFIDQEAPGIIQGKRPPADWPKTGEVEVKNLTIEYNPGEPVLRNLSFSVKAGEKIGVVGRTGAGKSTLSLAFLRFVEASAGQILLDNIDISQIGLEDLRSRVTIIPQDPVLFNGTIRSNLDPFNEHPDKVIWETLYRTYLAIEAQEESEEATNNIGLDRSKVTESQTSTLRMPTAPVTPNEEELNKDLEKTSVFTTLDAPILENGDNLSLGQRQLVALARALIRSSRLVIMDEATASVDFQTDHLIQTTIRGKEFSNSTLFCIAHRLRTIMDYDRVLVLDKGSIVEFDTPWNLLNKSEGGIFKDLCKRSQEYNILYQIAKKKAESNSN